MSNFGRNFHKIIPNGRVFLADAGYKLLKNILTPYKIQIGMPSDEAKYNYLHSSTRMTVERALGLFKGTFGIFRSKLVQANAEAMAKVIKTCIVLHNIFITYKEENEIALEEWMHLGGDISYPAELNQVEGDEAKRVRDRFKNYLMTL